MIKDKPLPSFLTVVLALAVGTSILAQPARQARSYTTMPAPDRRPTEGEGPFDRFVIRGVTIIDGSGAPARGPVDVVIEKIRIVEVRSVGTPKVPLSDHNRPPKGTKELDGHGMYLMPGFVDLHGHIGRGVTGAPAEFVYKLWLAHGVTTVREPGSGNGVDWTLREKARSASNSIVAPRIFVYVGTGAGWDGGPVTTPERAREWVRWAAKKGVDGLKLRAEDPPIMAALIDEARKNGLGTQAHLDQLGMARMNALDAARLGLGSLEHWYGLPESFLAQGTIQDLPDDYNYNNEQDRFGQGGRLWKQAAPPGSPKREAAIAELLEHQLVLDPTLTVYERQRDMMRDIRAEWHEKYTLPSQWRSWMPNRQLHGTYFYYWTTRDEIEWKRNYSLWLQFLNEYKDRGGRVCTGADSSGPFEQFGFEYVRELELLQEAGFYPLEVIRAATLCGAETLHEPKGQPLDFGIIRPGLLADLVLVDANPLANLKVLYGTGAIRLNDATGKVERVGGIKYVIKDGILYDPGKLLADIARMVETARKDDPITYTVPLVELTRP